MAVARLPFSIRDGAQIRIRVMHEQGSILELRQKGLAIPQPVEIDALIDPGAERTCVDPSIISRLGLPLFAFGLTAAPATSLPPLPIFGNVGVNTSHTASDPPASVWRCSTEPRDPICHRSRVGASTPGHRRPDRPGCSRLVCNGVRWPRRVGYAGVLRTTDGSPSSGSFVRCDCGCRTGACRDRRGQDATHLWCLV